MTFEIMGAPIPAARPRVCRYGTFNPKAKEQIKTGIEIKAQANIKKITGLPLEDPISLHVRFYMPIPKSYSKKKKDLLKGQPHIRRPDADNLLIFLMNSMNGIIFKDDSQVYDLTVTKNYSENPRTELSIVVYKKIGKTLQERLYG